MSNTFEQQWMQTLEFWCEESTYGSVLDILANIPTIYERLLTGTGIELDWIASQCKFNTIREVGETDQSFRERLWAEYLNGNYKLSPEEDKD